MKNFNKAMCHALAVATAMTLSAALGTAAHGQDWADLILINGKIFNGKYLSPASEKSTDLRPQTEDSLVSQGGKIVFVGSRQGALAYKTARTQLIDLNGLLVLPGFHDCHVHLCEGGIEMSGCLLNGSRSKQAALDKLKDYAEKHRHDAKNQKDAEQRWLYASGLPLPAVANNPLTKIDIDKIESLRPVIIYSEDAHSLWLNSRAMHKTKINAKTKTPPAGVIERDRTGNPNGAIREEAMALVEKEMPATPLKDRTAALSKAVRLANSLGITSIQDANTKEQFMTAYYELARKNQLNLKVVAALPVHVSDDEKDFDHLEQLRKKYSIGNFQATSAKIFADGVIETHTAAMLEPYFVDGSSGTDKGTLNYTEAQLKAAVIALDKRKFQVHIHAIGDRAVRAALDAFAAAKSINANADYHQHRHQIAHLEVVQKVDLPRFNALGVIANFQPYWAFYDPYMTELTAPVLGPTRMQLLYPLHSILATGAHLAAGSDWSVSTLSPLKAMQIAVTRQAPGKPFAKTLLKEECVSLPEILAAYTTGGAYANHSETSTGVLEVGKAADLIVLDQNIFAIAPANLGQAKVLKTFVDGKLVYDRSRPGDKAVTER